MGKPLGSPKTGGRKKGTPNFRTRSFMGQLEDLGFDPLKNFLELIPKLELKYQVRANLELLSFCYPRRKPTDEVESQLDILAERIAAAKRAEID